MEKNQEERSYLLVHQLAPEALELRDNDFVRYRGKGVLKAENVNKI